MTPAALPPPRCRCPEVGVPCPACRTWQATHRRESAPQARVRAPRSLHAKAMQARYQRQRRATFLAEGRCTRCGVTVPPGQVRCDRCVRYQQRRSTQMATQRKAQGVCPRCGSAPEAGMVLCRRCIDRSRQYQRRREAAS